jgi:Flp pilus assembly pilin Flp
MLKKFFKRIKSQKGMSGVLVALLLVMVGVGLVAGVKTFMDTQKGLIQTAAETKISEAITDSNTSS